MGNGAVMGGSGGVLRDNVTPCRENGDKDVPKFVNCAAISDGAIAARRCVGQNVEPLVNDFALLGRIPPTGDGIFRELRDGINPSLELFPEVFIERGIPTDVRRH